MSQEEQIAATMAKLNLSTTSNSTTFTNNQKRELVTLISETVTSILNPRTDDEDEQTIDFSRGLDSSERIPDVVKCLREFSGKAGEFSSWRKSVDRILQMYGQNRDTPKYFAILHTIRHKITSEADAALESYRTPLCWSKIKKCLMLHYGDKRDVSTLEYQMTTLSQRDNTVEVFYQQVYQYLSLILDKIDCLDLGEEALNAMTTVYRGKALDTFIRGLNGNLPSLLSVREPASLPQALQMCLKLSNMNYRTNHANSLGRMQPNNKSAIQQRLNTTKRPFYPELANLSYSQFPRTTFTNRYGQNQYGQTQFGQNRPYSSFQPFNRPPLPPKPPVPMEVDRSIQTRQVNYQNRPQNQQIQNFSRPALQAPFNRVPQNSNNYNQANKRPPSQSTPQPGKFQRVFNTEAVECTSTDCANDSMEWPEGYYNNTETYQHESETENYETEETSIDDINFLD